jgi:hypothetical protein
MQRYAVRASCSFGLATVLLTLAAGCQGENVDGESAGAEEAAPAVAAVALGLPGRPGGDAITFHFNLESSAERSRSRPAAMGQGALDGARQNTPIEKWKAPTSSQGRRLMLKP